MDTKALREDIEMLTDSLDHIENRIRPLMESIVGVEPREAKIDTPPDRGDLKSIVRTCRDSALRIEELVARLEDELLPGKPAETLGGVSAKAG